MILLFVFAVKVLVVPQVTVQEFLLFDFMLKVISAAHVADQEVILLFVFAVKVFVAPQATVQEFLLFVSG